jgi:hypothetical protein
MEMSKKQTEFWVALLVLCIIFAVAIMLVDFGIKSSILEQSNRIRLLMEDWEIRNGRITTGATDIRDNDDHSNDIAFPGDVLLFDPPGMETGNADNGTAEKTDNTSTRRSKPIRPTSPRTIPHGDK